MVKFKVKTSGSVLIIILILINLLSFFFLDLVKINQLQHKNLLLNNKYIECKIFTKVLLNKIKSSLKKHSFIFNNYDSRKDMLGGENIDYSFSDNSLLFKGILKDKQLSCVSDFKVNLMSCNVSLNKCNYTIDIIYFDGSESKYFVM